METPTFIESYDTDQYDLCDKIIARLEEILNNKEDDRFHYYMNGSETNGGATRRVDHSILFHQIEDPLCADIHAILQEYIGVYAQKYHGFASCHCMSKHVKVQKTPPKGGFHIWHKEHGGSDKEAFRVLTWTLYLNDIPEGEGETEFLEYGVKVQPKKGRLCFFPAGWTHIHRGNPVYSCDKYIATGWYYFT